MTKNNPRTSPTSDPDELMRIVEELAETNRRLLNRENELRRKQFFREIYNQIVTSLIANENIKTALQSVLQLICEATDSEIGLIILVSPDDNRLVPIVSYNLGHEPPDFDPSQGITGFAAKEKKRIITGDIPDDFPFRIRKTHDLDVSPKVLMVQPLMSSDQLTGLLVIGSLSNYSTEVLDLVERVSVQIAMAVLKAVTLQRTINLARELKFKTTELNRKYVELEKAHQIKSAFLATVSHELKTPLNAIIGFSRVLRKGSHGSLNPRQQEYLDYILNNGEHLLSLIDNILDLSRIEAGRVELVRQDINIFSVLDECVHSVHSLAEKKNQTLTISCGREIPGLKADRSKLKQIIFNLLSNAIKFGPEGDTITIRVQLTEYGDEIKVSITDHGPGVPPEDRERIFEPFVRTSAAVTQDGTGLGLPLARKLVELHGGRLWVEPEPVSGSTFAFTLPVFGFEPQPKGHEIVKLRTADHE